MRKILWVNPSFLDYRIPLYKELNSLFENNFYLLFSPQRVPTRCVKKIRNVLGNNALTLYSEKQFVIGKKGDFSNSNIMLTFPRGLYKKICNVEPEAIIAEGFFQFTPWAVWYSIWHKIPLLIAYERTAHTERNCPWWRRFYRQLIGKFVSGYVVNGSLTKEYLISQGVVAGKIYTGAMCADSIGLATLVKTLSQKQISEIKQTIFNKPVLGISYIFVGRMIPLKGVSYLLQGWTKHIKRFPNDRLLLVGDGPLLHELRNKYDDKETVIFAGNIDYSEIYKYYAISDVFIIPTLEDNWSLVVPEAMACGLPIACSVYNGCYPELVHHGENGTVFDPLNEESVINTLEYFHFVDLNEMGKKSIQIESRFNPQETAKNIFSAVENTIDDWRK